MYIPLYYTSFVFGYTSILTTGTWMQSAFLWLMAFSILNHRNIETHNYNAFVDIIDMMISHYIGSRSLYEALTCNNNTRLVHKEVVLYYICFGYIIWLYYVKKNYKLPSPYWQRWHATIHLVSGFGCYLLAQTPCVK